MLFRTLRAAVYGIDANLIDVEVDVGEHRSQKENFMTVGLPDAAVRESSSGPEELRPRNAADEGNDQSRSRRSLGCMIRNCLANG